jgi:hypothetical protein
MTSSFVSIISAGSHLVTLYFFIHIYSVVYNIEDVKGEKMKKGANSMQCKQNKTKHRLRVFPLRSLRLCASARGLWREYFGENIRKRS